MQNKYKSVKTYITINSIMGGIILLIIGYSAFFAFLSTTPPIPSQHNFTVASTGLSRAFVEIIKGNFSQALSLNPLSIRVFTFFFIQLVLRLIISTVLLSSNLNQKLLLKIDIIQAVLLFLWSFGVVMVYQIKMVLLMY